MCSSDLRAWRASSFVRETTGRMPSNPKMDPGPSQGPPRVAPCHLRAARRPPSRLRRRPQRTLPRLCATNIVTTLVTPGAAMGRVVRVLHGTKEASMHAEVLAKMAYSRKAMIELLLMWLGVGARHGPRSFCRRPHRRKLWRARSCSSTSLLLRKSSMSGGPPSGALSASPTKTSNGQRGPQASALLNHRMPAVEGLEVLRPRCTLLLHASHRGCRSVMMTLVITFP